ncbi:MAG: hypothetical protein RL264_2756 [Bacteroidota bacterium]|jgi:mRNA-degrading endonuclease RelE of RelBE toxin-antitoxin system
MAYNVSLKKRAIKALEKINEPYFSNIKKLFMVLPLTQDQRVT